MDLFGQSPLRNAKIIGLYGRIWTVMDDSAADTPSAMIQYLSYGLGHAWD
jgi:hypothetical protein